MEQHIHLIGGTGRSGTTILKQIFARHPDVTNVPEWRFLIDPDGLIDFYATCQVWSPFHYDLRIKRLQRLLYKIGSPHPLSKIYFLLHKLKLFGIVSHVFRPAYVNLYITKHCPIFFELVDELIERLCTLRYSGHWIGMDVFWHEEIWYRSFPDRAVIADILGDFLRHFIESILTQQHVTHYLEKNTWNILWFDKILELLPEARLVHVYRDPRDVVASYMRQSWMPSEPMQCAQIYKDSIERWWNIRQNIPEHSFIEISLENLVEQPETVLRKLCKFWEIPWHDSLLSTDLSKSHTGRWKYDIAPEKHKKIHTILQQQLAAMGYD